MRHSRFNTINDTDKYCAAKIKGMFSCAVTVNRGPRFLVVDIEKKPNKKLCTN